MRKNTGTNGWKGFDKNRNPVIKNMPAQILKFQRKVIDEQTYVCAKIKKKLKGKEWKSLRAQLNACVDDFLNPEPDSE